MSVCLSVCLYACLCVLAKTASPAKTAEPIKVLLEGGGADSCGPKVPCIRWGYTQTPPVAYD